MQQILLSHVTDLYENQEQPFVLKLRTAISQHSRQGQPSMCMAACRTMQDNMDSPVPILKCSTGCLYQGVVNIGV